jgi:hypothetical protein
MISRSKKSQTVGSKGSHGTESKTGLPLHHKPDSRAAGQEKTHQGGPIMKHSKGFPPELIRRFRPLAAFPTSLSRISLCIMLALAAGLLAVTGAQATVVTFDDLGSVNDPLNLIPDGYAGFHWFETPLYMRAADCGLSDSGFGRGTVSSPGILFTDGTIGISRDVPFILDGFYVTSGWSDTDAVVRAYLNGATVGEDSYPISPEGPRWYAPTWSGPIDTLLLSGTTSQIVVDNFTYSSVPIPSAFMLLGPGLAGLAAMRRKVFGAA